MFCATGRHVTKVQRGGQQYLENLYQLCPQQLYVSQVQLHYNLHYFSQICECQLGKEKRGRCPWPSGTYNLNLLMQTHVGT